MQATHGRLVNQQLGPLLAILCAISAVGSQTTSGYFPQDVKMCSTKDPNLDTCFTDSANRMLKHLIKGSRKLNVVSLDPLYIPLMSLQRNNNLLPTLAFNLTDSIHEGWKDAVVLRSKVNPKEKKFNIVIKIPEYRFSGPYDVSGSIIGIPLEGSGDVECTFFNMTNNILMRGHLEERFEKQYFVIDDFHQKTHIEKVKVYMDNLFNDPKLTEATNKLLNENGRAALDEGSDVKNEVWGALHAGLMQRIFRRVPYRDMFPDLD